MLKSLDNIRTKNIDIYPIKCLIDTREKNYNFQHLKSMKELSSNLVLNYIVRNLEILDSKGIVDDKILHIVEEVILWSDVAKVGSLTERKVWRNRNYNLVVHNIGSSQIYRDYSDNYDEVIYVLIKTHGLIGQCVKSEVNIKENREIYGLLERKLIDKDSLCIIFTILNECVIGAVSYSLYEKVKDEVLCYIDLIINNRFDEKIDVIKRIARLNGSISNEEENILRNMVDNKVENLLLSLFSNTEIWFYESALKNFSIDNQLKILLICSCFLKCEKYLSFEPLMRKLYLDYDGVKTVNIYKKRIIESYLNSLKVEDIVARNFGSNPHIKFHILNKDGWMTFDFKFSTVSRKLIDFCEVAYVSDLLYQKSVFMLYDLFGFRRDGYDRFYNEIDYLKTMNSTINYKARILEYMVGKNVLDVGPGGGALMDLILDNYKDMNVYGIDISSNVIEALTSKKQRENRAYNLVKGNALTLEKYFEKGKIDTIIFCSIIHELFSYIEYDGRKFNYDVIKDALKSAYDILPIGGRLIIRDGIMTEPLDIKRIIRFKNPNDINILKRYCNDFKGRCIKYELIDDYTVKMLINDAMEFLYTYTWGEDSYPHEVNEQFGYFTPSEYENFAKDNLPSCKIIHSEAFLQDGYSINLLPKITIYDDKMNVVDLPNSTYILVIEKGI